MDGLIIDLLSSAGTRRQLIGGGERSRDTGPMLRIIETKSTNIEHNTPDASARASLPLSVLEKEWSKNRS